MPEYDAEKIGPLESAFEQRRLKFPDQLRILDAGESASRGGAKCRIFMGLRLLQQQIEEPLTDVLHADTEYRLQLACRCSRRVRFTVQADPRGRLAFERFTHRPVFCRYDEEALHALA